MRVIISKEKVKGMEGDGSASKMTIVEWLNHTKGRKVRIDKGQQPDDNSDRVRRCGEHKIHRELKD